MARTREFIVGSVARFVAEIDKETDGRYIADVKSIPGCTTYGLSEDEAVCRANLLVLEVLLGHTDVMTEEMVVLKTKVDQFMIDRRVVSA